MKFRKKPIIVEAEQWWPDKDIPGVYRIGMHCNTLHGNWCKHHQLFHSLPIFKIDTLEGPLTVSPGDWIITGVKGERYPCKPDIFEATYDPV